MTAEGPLGAVLKLSDSPDLWAPSNPLRDGGALFGRVVSVGEVEGVPLVATTASYDERFASYGRKRLGAGFPVSVPFECFRIRPGALAHFVVELCVLRASRGWRWSKPRLPATTGSGVMPRSAKIASWRLPKASTEGSASTWDSELPWSVRHVVDIESSGFWARSSRNRCGCR